MVKKNYFKILVVVFLISVIIQSSYFIVQIKNIENINLAARVFTQGIVKLGINTPPEIINTTCPESMRESIEIGCKMIGYDLDGNNFTITRNESYALSLSPQTSNLNPETQEVTIVPITVTPDGNVTIKSYIDTPDNYYMLLGNHSINFYIYDDSGMENGRGDIYVYQLEIYDFNDPPVLISPIPDQSIIKDQNLIILDLDDYFEDPDYGQELTYTVSGSSAILVTIVANSKVIAYSTVCTTETVTFTATDPYNLSATSNPVKIEVNCGSQVGEGSSSSSSSGSSGSSSSYTCISDWQCDPWEPCTPNGTQKSRCVDQLACNPSHFIYWRYQNCTYVPPPICQEVWSCEKWNECTPDNIQTRTCNELNNCDTELEKPATTMNCTYIPTCEDGLQNQGETGVDCGGPCLPCQTIQTPGITENKNDIPSILLLIALLVLSILLVYKYFHKEINTAIARTLLSMIDKRKKKIFLTEKNAKEILEKLWVFEKSLDKSIKNKAVELATIGREYFFRSTLKLESTFNKEQLEKAIVDYKVQPPLNKIFTLFYDRITGLETKKQKIYKMDLLIFIEEFRELIQLTANISLEKEASKKDREIKETALKDEDSDVVSIKKNIYNTYITMQFGEVEISKDKYSKIIKIYENLSEENKSLFYDNIARLFNEIKYLVSITE